MGPLGAACGGLISYISISSRLTPVCLFNTTTTIISLMDVNDSNNLSELDSLSDSDWLDISSRASEDTDSVAGFDDSDREDRPPSRRSLISTDSSRDGEVQGWEGLVEEENPEDARVLEVVDGEAVPYADSLGSPALRTEPLPISGSRYAHADEEDAEEDERVKAALDQSMMSTLNSSRSGSLSPSLQTSLIQSRDLRLSFPDPLTSSHEEAKDTSSEDIVSQATLPVDVGADPASNLAPAAGPVTIVAEPDAYIVLHGFSSMTKWSVIETLLEKMAQSVDLTLSPERVYKSDGCLRFFIPHKESNVSNHSRCISVLDFTEFTSIDDDTYVGLSLSCCNLLTSTPSSRAHFI